MIVGVTGCSNSSYGWGNPWYHYMGLEYNCKIISSSSGGFGNEINIEKIHQILKSNKIDLFICQLTDPSRLVLGLDNQNYMNDNKFSTDLHEPNRINDIGFKSFNVGNLNDKEFSKNIEEINIIEASIASKYNLYYKIFHTIMSMQYLCDFYSTKLVFFSWFLDLYKLSQISGYRDVLDKINMIPDFIGGFRDKNNVPDIPNDGHLNSESHSRVFYEYINPYLIEKNLIQTL